MDEEYDVEKDKKNQYGANNGKKRNTKKPTTTNIITAAKKRTKQSKGML